MNDTEAAGVTPALNSKTVTNDPQMVENYTQMVMNYTQMVMHYTQMVMNGADTETITTTEETITDQGDGAEIVLAVRGPPARAGRWPGRSARSRSSWRCSSGRWPCSTGSAGSPRSRRGARGSRGRSRLVGRIRRGERGSVGGGGMSAGQSMLAWGARILILLILGILALAWLHSVWRVLP